MLEINKGESREAAGNNCFSPMLNLIRHPLWGRAQEAYGEDPYHVAMMGDTFIRALQGAGEVRNVHGEPYLRLAGCPKHFAVHSGPENTRLSDSYSVGYFDLYDSYLVPFETAVRCANASQVMPAYSGLTAPESPDGAPDCANPYLLKTILREEWNRPDISVISDNGGVEFIDEFHHYAPNRSMSVALAMHATTDIDLYGGGYVSKLGTALSEGLAGLTEADVDEAVYRSMLLRIRTGDFDPVENIPFNNLGAENINTPAARAVAIESAASSVVLLNNTLGLLPLKFDTRTSILVVEPFSYLGYMGTYGGRTGDHSTISEAVSEVCKNPERNCTSSWNVGCAGYSAVVCKSSEGIPSAVKAAESADLIIAVLGTSSGGLESEGRDRPLTYCNGAPEAVPILGLPGCQRLLLSALVATGRPVVLVIIHANPVTPPLDIPVSALLTVASPGAIGAIGVVEVLFGDVNPSGRLPFTLYKSVVDIPDVEEYHLWADPGFTHRYSTKEHAFPFAYGLSYSKFTVSKLYAVPMVITPCESVTVSVVVENEGPLDGDFVIPVFLKAYPTIHPDHPLPRRNLVGFEKLHDIKKGDSRTLKMVLDLTLFSLVDARGQRMLYPGVYSIEVEGLTVNVTMNGQEPVDLRQECSVLGAIGC